MTSSSPDKIKSLLTSQLGTILAICAVLGLVYACREVFEILALAAFLSLLIAPLVRSIKRLGISQASAVLCSMGGLSAIFLCLGVVIGLQVISMASSLPKYEATVRGKIEIVEAATIGKMDALRVHAKQAVGASMRQGTETGDGYTASHVGFTGILPVEVHEPPPTASQAISQFLSSIKGPLGTAAVVVVVLIFMLLEQDSLRDRFIRVLGGSNLQGTTRALDDAGQRLSKLFVSQFAVNFGVGIAVWIGLFAIGVPHATVWAVLVTVLRFVPYVGILVAASGAVLLAAAVDPGWAMLWQTLVLFAVVELVVAQFIEPHLYGHSTGLSPLSVVVAAIFWSWIWGPIGLLLSTPLTLCLVVAGRHVESLRYFDLILGDAPALTHSQRFYQRALAGDADEIIGAARLFLKRNSFSKYCDGVLMPALQLASTDYKNGSITPEQLRKSSAAVVHAIQQLGSAQKGRDRWRRRATVLEETNIGLHLRLQREVVAGKWQGPLAVPDNSVVVCMGMETEGDELVAEILVRVLQQGGFDARHIPITELSLPAPSGSTSQSIAMFMLVRGIGSNSWGSSSLVATQLRERFPNIMIVGAIPSIPVEIEENLAGGVPDLFVSSFDEALQLVRNSCSGHD